MKYKNTAIFKKLDEFISVLKAYLFIEEDEEEKTKTSNIVTKDYFKREKVFDDGNRPEFYAGSNLFIYSKYLLIMLFS